KASVIQRVDDGTKIPRSTADAMHKENGDLLRVIWLEKVDPAAIIPEEVVESPHAGGRVLSTEAFIIDRDDFSDRAQRKETDALLLLRITRQQIADGYAVPT